MARGKAATTNPLAAGVNESADDIGICRNTLWNAIRAHELEVVRVGRRVLVLRAELERWLTERSGLWAAEVPDGETGTDEGAAHG